MASSCRDSSSFGQNSRVLFGRNLFRRRATLPCNSLTTNPAHGCNLRRLWNAFDAFGIHGPFASKANGSSNRANGILVGRDGFEPTMFTAQGSDLQSNATPPNSPRPESGAVVRENCWPSKSCKSLVINNAI